ncbi:integrase [Frateuria sp. GZRR33]|uniref:hypothetical protein n=1 Tax=Frateuria sp. GZRR33 TaxID=3351535 RepID=UPI003EDC348B
MSGNIVHFVPPSVRRVADNREAFIRLCRDDLTVFGRDLNWASWKWPGALFTKMSVPSRGVSADDLLDSGIMEFAKAYFRYQQGMKPTGTKNELKAIRAIEAALLSCRERVDIDLVDADVLDRAEQLSREHYSEAAAYHAARELERLAVFLDKNRLVRAAVGQWKRSTRKPRDVTIQTGPDARAKQAAKLPSQDALNALAEIFSNNPDDPRDIFTASTFAMTLCAPVRITEVLELPADCEVEEPDFNGINRYGWRFYSGKGYEGDIRWIPSVMVPIAKEAIARVRALTEPARCLARWLESHPDEFFGHPGCPPVAQDMPLSGDQVCAALGVKSLWGAGLSRRPEGYTLRDLAHWIKAKQPEDFPWVSRRANVRFSNALFCMTKNQLHAQRGASPVILWSPTGTVFNSDLGPRPGVESEHRSIFDRYGYHDSDGERLKLTSHQARHLLNTIANRGGMSQDLIAKWSGRADKKQNRVYNHMDEFERVAEAETIDPGRELFGPDGQVSAHAPISMNDLALVERGAVHATDYGVCVHDYVVSPCDRFRDCLNCHEQVCIKGDMEKEKRIRLRKREVEIDLAAARDAVDKGYMGADRWLEHHEKLGRRLAQLVAILDDPAYPNGSLIKLSDGGDYSHLGRAIKEKLLHDTLEAPGHRLGHSPALEEK